MLLPTMEMTWKNILFTTNNKNRITNKNTPRTGSYKSQKRQVGAHVFGQNEFSGNVLLFHSGHAGLARAVGALRPIVNRHRGVEHPWIRGRVIVVLAFPNVKDVGVGRPGPP